MAVIHTSTPAGVLLCRGQSSFLSQPTPTLPPRNRHVLDLTLPAQHTIPSNPQGRGEDAGCVRRAFPFAE